MTLEEKIALYYVKNKECNKLYNEAEELKAQIKEEMAEKELTGLKSGDYSVVISTQNRSKMNEGRLLKFLEDRGLEQAIQTVRKPNDKVLEDMLYNGELTNNMLESCVDVSISKVLKVTKR